MPKIPQKFRPPDGGIKETPPPLPATFLLGMKKFQRTLVCFRGLRPVFVFFVLLDLRVFLEKAEGRRAV
ncbi:MAG TPA: hypothetical protein DCY08_03815, partial [Bacteroides stercoris]|nr:hypothetical protein [Bacteroides stercoris]